MCGRYKQISLEAFLAGMGVALPAEFVDAGIVAPGMMAPVLRGGALETMYWGYLPRWAKEGKPLINARAETIFEKPSFRDSVQARRCVIPADGFFEWDKTQRPTQPYDIEPEGLVAFAGIWDTWQGRDGFAILTTAALPAISRVHDRMPVVLRSAEECRRWLAAPDPRLLTADDSLAFTLTATEQFTRPANSDFPEDNNQLSLF
ncbi:MAG TPA: SOS response-associated peptidase [Patescibacteria group bacterium]|nr:SOS response-associated peptidase [Patescibacteria group bacterium]